MGEHPLPLRLRLPATPESIPTARHAVSDYAREAGGHDGFVYDIALAVTEAVTNAVRHGYPDSRPGHVRIDASATAGELDVTIRDDGCGPAPPSRQPGLGMGIPLMKNVSDTFSIRGGPGDGTHVRLRFRIS